MTGMKTNFFRSAHKILHAEDKCLHLATLIKGCIFSSTHMIYKLEKEEKFKFSSLPIDSNIRSPHNENNQLTGFPNNWFSVSTSLQIAQVSTKILISLNFLQPLPPISATIPAPPRHSHINSRGTSIEWVNLMQYTAHATISERLATLSVLSFSPSERTLLLDAITISLQTSTSSQEDSVEASNST